jgi:CSLREA domain-containing protein
LAPFVRSWRLALSVPDSLRAAAVTQEIDMSSFPLLRARKRALLIALVCLVFLVFASFWTVSQRASIPSHQMARHSDLAGLLSPDKGVFTPDASTITVNNTSDAANSSDGFCTLREAITAANSNAASGAVAGECAAGSNTGSDTINFSITGIVNLTGALPNIASDMTITGPGSGQLTVRRDTGGDYRILTINSGTVTISGISVANGKTADGSSGSLPTSSADGGGILNFGTLTLTDVALTGNRTGNGGTGTITNGGASGNGGAIANVTSLTMTNCTVSGNTVGTGGPGMTLGGAGGSGGGIFSSGSVTLSNSTITGNQAGAGGSGGAGSSVAAVAEFIVLPPRAITASPTSQSAITLLEAEVRRVGAEGLTSKTLMQ